ncbi:HsdR family type I site-specific deoxyribonuclease [Desulfobacterales bacterium HSG2]|nr:HsdR family type I site-specific deoxyribonuclease [Desulfobacterales bacterium HSG2]
MRNYISEDDIEKAAIELFKTRLGYDHTDCFHTDNSGRGSEKEVVFKPRLKTALENLNPHLPKSAIRDAVGKLSKSRQSLSSVLANKDISGRIKDGVRVKVQNKSGKKVTETVKIINFNKPEKNDFLLVSQLWIQGSIRKRRPDLIIYINGLPLVFIELKNSDIPLKTAYDDNLTDYKRDIPHLFHYNAFAILSNGMETRVGSFNAEWEHFGQWLKIEDEKENIDRKKIEDEKISLEYALLGLCEKKRLLDYIENFIFHYQDTVKIVAKNHQFLGVNNAISAFKKRKGKRGKLGVFWHTQGSGKSFSMIMFTRKIFRKFQGNYTFLIITDREDLDDQIYRNFLYTGAVSASEKARPNSGAHLREMLGENRRYIFTLIQKFHYPKGKKYPLLSDRSDIIVIVDEAHRTQYKDLAENMRKGLPNAQYMAFTATPLLGKRRLTNEWFGDYVSEYNFKQSCEDGSTVPLFYEKRVPEVQIINEELNEEFTQLVENENLTEKQQARLENKFATELEVIKREDRLRTVAKDIVYHFPRRGYRGKGMVVSVDKFTAVKMYDNVQQYWKTEIRNLNKEIQNAADPDKKAELKRIRDYMKRIDMAVVISYEQDETEKFEKEGLGIKRHRKRLNEVDENGHDIEYKFKDPDDPLQLVFLCAMWLTGFDAPTVSTLYIDKPLKNHTLMQAIARAIRVAAEKTSGLIIDYYGVFRNLRKAFTDYTIESKRAKNRKDREGETPIQDKQKLYDLLDEAIRQGIAFCRSLNIDLEDILYARDTFQNLTYFQEFANIILAKDENKKQFAVYENTITALYNTCKPEILSDAKERPMVQVFQYLRKVVNREIGDGMDLAAQHMSQLLDESVIVAEEQPAYETFEIRTGDKIDLNKLDFKRIRKSFKQTDYKHIEITDLRLFIEKKLKQMLARNVNRISFIQRFQRIIDEYNAGSLNVENYFEELMKFSEDMRQEDERHRKEKLTQEELEIFDLLCKENLSRKEKQRVKLAAKTLLAKLQDEEEIFFTIDWHKDTQTRLIVKNVMMDVLDDTLPESYDRKTYDEKCDAIFNHFFDIAESGRNFAAA